MRASHLHACSFRTSAPAASRTHACMPKGLLSGDHPAAGGQPRLHTWNGFQLPGVIALSGPVHATGIDPTHRPHRSHLTRVTSRTPPRARLTLTLTGPTSHRDATVPTCPYPPATSCRANHTPHFSQPHTIARWPPATCYLRQVVICAPAPHSPECARPRRFVPLPASSPGPGLTLDVRVSPGQDLSRC